MSTEVSRHVLLEKPSGTKLALLLLLDVNLAPFNMLFAAVRLAVVAEGAAVDVLAQRLGTAEVGLEALVTVTLKRNILP